ncbi:hypothetical protein AGMMS50239_40620 [Bacteroidia bacterium]|nr:hypothetical protein AGMMS50239_40620 [Bacteroidia bacterium]
MFNTNFSSPFAHILISFQSIRKGLEKLVLNNQAIENDLEKVWAVVAEGIQTILRREGYPNPYEALKNLTRTNEQVTEKLIHDFINALDVNNEVKEELKSITPQNYTGI